MIYGEKLKELRETKNLTQAEIAEYLGVHFTAYSQFEREYTIIPIKHLNTLCNYYGVSLDYIFGFTKQSDYKDSLKDIDIKKSSLRLKEFRKENKISQIELSKLLNTGFSTISAYERQRYIIATAYLYTICKKYSISADYLLGKIDEPKYIN